MEQGNQAHPHKGRLLFVSNTFWSMHNFRLDVLQHFTREGYEVHVAARADLFVPKLQEYGCHIHPIDINNGNRNPFKDFLLLTELFRLYRRLKPDLIFHYVIKPNVYGSVAAGYLGIPAIAVVTGLGYSFERNDWLYQLVQFMYGRALRRVKEVWFLNQEDAELFLTKGLVRPRQVNNIFSEGINTSLFRRTQPHEELADKPFTFYLFTRYLWSKGLSTLAEAVRILRQRGYTFRIIMHGFHFPFHPDSIPAEQISDWEQEGLFEIGGFVENVREKLENAHCVIVPSATREGTPRSLLEAMSMEIPVISSDNIGTSKIVVNRENGLLFHPSDAESLALAMRNMINMSWEERKAMGQTGRQLVEKRFAMPHIVRQYQDAVDKYLPAVHPIPEQNS